MKETGQDGFLAGIVPCKAIPEVDLLIVEPDQGVREALVEAFEVEGFRVCSVAGRVEALQALQHWRFHHALVDVGSEGRVGMGLLDELRRFPGTRLGAMSVRSGLSEDAQGHGADRFWVKPLAPAEVSDWMRPGPVGRPVG